MVSAATSWLVMINGLGLADIRVVMGPLSVDLRDVVLSGCYPVQLVE